MSKRIISMILTAIVCLSCMSVGVSAAPAEGGTLELSAPSAILIEQTTGNVLFEKNPDERRPLASVTKIMTMLLTMEAIDGGKITLEDKVVASERSQKHGRLNDFP